MPIEIRELVIKAQVKDSSEAKMPLNGNGIDKETIIRDCVDQVLEILAKKGER